jgi:tRNA G18 (ribose-2'-O)-methylase SpoU
VLEQCEARVTIPLREGGAESLNVAAAAAIACHRMREARPDA